jgi:hypothetical protein
MKSSTLAVGRLTHHDAEENPTRSSPPSTTRPRRGFRFATTRPARSSIFRPCRAAPYGLTPSPVLGLWNVKYSAERPLPSAIIRRQIESDIERLAPTAFPETRSCAGPAPNHRSTTSVASLFVT